MPSHYCKVHGWFTPRTWFAPDFFFSADGRETYAACPKCSPQLNERKLSEFRRLHEPHYQAPSLPEEFTITNEIIESAVARRNKIYENGGEDMDTELAVRHLQKIKADNPELFGAIMQAFELSERALTTGLDGRAAHRQKVAHEIVMTAIKSGARLGEGSGLGELYLRAQGDPRAGKLRD